MKINGRHSMETIRKMRAGHSDLNHEKKPVVWADREWKSIHDLWSYINGLSIDITYLNFWKRIVKQGWDIDKAINTPVKKPNKKS